MIFTNDVPFYRNTTAYDVEQVDIALAQNMSILIIVSLVLPS